MKDEKNVQVIDGAQNSTYGIFAACKDDFEKIFPESGQDIEFILKARTPCGLCRRDESP